jgi:hypothetical protein
VTKLLKDLEIDEISSAGRGVLVTLFKRDVSG